MAKTKISEFSSTPANNTDIDSINIAEGCAPSNINDAIRELMAQLKDFQIGSQGDSFNGPIGTSTAAAGAFTTLTASSTLGVTGVSTLTGGAVVQGLTVGRGAGAVSTNTAVGASALAANTSGAENTAVGNGAAGATTTGNYNTAMGRNTFALNTTGSSNAAFGQAALYTNSGGSNNTGIGFQALALNTTQSNSTAVGYQALYANTTGASNVAVGATALTANTTGNSNTAVGRYTLQSNTTGSSNTALGQYSMPANTTGTSNTAVGSDSLGVSTTGNYNTAIGMQALTSNTTASNNTAVGYQALYSQTNPTGTNTAFGYQAGYAVTTGYDNLLLGDGAGYVSTALTTGTGNICIGTSTRTNSASATNQINIGYGVTGQGNSNVTLGSYQGKIYNAYTSNATWTQTSDGRLKTNVQDDTLGLSFINRLRPVKFNWKPSNEIDQSLPYYNETNQRDTETVIHGLIAQEVKAALDAEGVSTFAGWDEGSDGIQAISREMFVSPLIKAIQELSAQVETLKAEIALLKGN